MNDIQRAVKKARASKPDNKVIEMLTRALGELRMEVLNKEAGYR